jgi:hypothetical protein
MPRWFNTAGPCQDDIHYILPPTRRLPSLEQIITQEGPSFRLITVLFIHDNVQSSNRN